MSLSPFLRTNRRLLTALACYAALIAVALCTLLPIQSSDDRFILGFVLFFFAILIIKTIIHAAEDRDRD